MTCYKPGRQLDALIHSLIGGKVTEKPPKYSTSMLTAWKLLDRFPRFGFQKSEMPEHYYVEIIFHMGMGTFEDFKADADTAPMAVCLAVLKLKGIE